MATKASCSTFVGLTGIVLRETANTFQVGDAHHLGQAQFLQDPALAPSLPAAWSVRPGARVAFAHGGLSKYIHCAVQRSFPR